MDAKTQAVGALASAVDQFVSDLDSLPLTTEERSQAAMDAIACVAMKVRFRIHEPTTRVLEDGAVDVEIAINPRRWPFGNKTPVVFRDYPPPVKCGENTPLGIALKDSTPAEDGRHVVEILLFSPESPLTLSDDGE